MIGWGLVLMLLCWTTLAWAQITFPGGGGSGTDDQTAAEVPFTPVGTIAATDVQAAIAEVAVEASGTDDQTAAEVPFTPAGLFAATDVQAALEEIDTDRRGILANAPACLVGTTGHIYTVTDAVDGSDCTVGGNPDTINVCVCDGTEYTDAGGGATPTLDQSFDVGNVIDGASCETRPLLVGGGTRAIVLCEDAAGDVFIRVCDPDGTSNCETRGIKMEPGSDFLILQEDGNTCLTMDSDTNVWTVGTAGDCAEALTITGNVDVTGTLRGGMPVATISTTPYTMTTADCGKLLRIATGAVEIDLIPDPTAGITGGTCVLCLVQNDAVQTDFDPDVADTIVGNDQTGTAMTLAAGDRLRWAAKVDDQLCLEGKDAATWRVWSGTAALSDAN